jgi:phospho-N-acetylmuramoyl-pentapeptide-transferase
LHVLRYPSFRIIASALTALVLSFLLGPWFIRRLTERQIGQPIRDDGPKSHLSKRGTPTMGGSLILFSLIVPTLLWTDLSNRMVLVLVSVTVAYGLIGFADDYLKVRYKNSRGVPGRAKFALQTGVAAGAIGYLFHGQVLPDPVRLKLSIPFVNFQHFSPSLPLLVYVVFGVFVVVAFSNAVNLTDGLDGLAIGPVIINAGTYLVLAYIAGATFKGTRIAEYLYIAYLPGSSELAVYCGAMFGAGIGFLWFNTYPAQVFMGDVGSLSLGGGIGMLAVLTKNELLAVIIGGIFVIETVSVMVQVTSFKLTGKRVFKMAPIHHHYEQKGWAEPKVIVRFWIISFMLALVALSSLKLR